MKNKAIKTDIKQSFWSVKLLLILALVATASFLVGSLFPINSNRKTPSTTTLPAESKKLLYINPLLVVQDFRNQNTAELKNLEELIATTVSDLNKYDNSYLESIFFQDLTNSKQISYNANEYFSPASLMKVPIMIALLKMSEEKPEIMVPKITFLENREAIYTKRKASERNNTILAKGISYSIFQLMEIMISESDNEATILLLDYLNSINSNYLDKVQRDLGLEIPDSVVYTEDFITVKKYSSFFRTLYNASYLNDDHSELALAILKQSGYGFGIRQAIPVNVEIAHKYGHKLIREDFHELHHFAVVYHPKKPFILGVMTKGKDLEKLKTLIASITKVVYNHVNDETRKTTTRLKRDLE